MGRNRRPIPRIRPMLFRSGRIFLPTTLALSFFATHTPTATTGTMRIPAPTIHKVGSKWDHLISPDAIWRYIVAPKMTERHNGLRSRFQGPWSTVSMLSTDLASSFCPFLSTSRRSSSSLFTPAPKVMRVLSSVGGHLPDSSDYPCCSRSVRDAHRRPLRPPANGQRLRRGHSRLANPSKAYFNRDRIAAAWIGLPSRTKLSPMLPARRRCTAATNDRSLEIGRMPTANSANSRPTTRGDSSNPAMRPSTAPGTCLISAVAKRRHV